MNLEPVRRILDALGVRYALIGGHDGFGPLHARRSSPSSSDYDGLADQSTG